MGECLSCIAARPKDFSKETKSLCPECLAVIDAEIYEVAGKIRIKKRCTVHGEFDDLYWSDSALYRKFAQWGVEDTEVKQGCPFDCGLCPEHRSSTMLAIVDVTNRCNQRCPICFANAAVSGYLYEPTMEQLEQMMRLLRSEVPPCPAVQFAGGEPTVRKDFVQIVRRAHELGFPHTQVATNGVKMARSVSFCHELKEAGLHTVYLQFDGVTNYPYQVLRGYPALSTKIKAIGNCWSGGIKSVVLVPTVVKGVNDDQLGDIIRFAARWSDIVKGVNFQPVAFEGRIDAAERKKQRITIPDILHLLEEQTNGEIPVKAFYPVPFVLPISYFVEAWKRTPQIEFTVHPHCGAATYVFTEKGRFIPITEFLDVEGFMEFLRETAAEMNGSRISGIKTTAALFIALCRFIDRDKVPEDLHIVRLLFNILVKGKREATAEFSRQSLYIGTMHFMDPYNFDLERVRRCGIHYATPDGRIIPFCTYNALHRPGVERAFAQTS